MQRGSRTERLGDAHHQLQYRVALDERQHDHGRHGQARGQRPPTVDPRRVEYERRECPAEEKQDGDGPEERALFHPESLAQGDAGSIREIRAAVQPPGPKLERTKHCQWDQ